jgi:Predicted membrane protein
MNEVTQQAPSSEGTAKVVYILYLVGIIFGLTGIIGVVMAYINKREAPDWLQTHYQFQIRTFWIGLLYVLIGMVSSVILIGYLVLLFWVVWLVIRCVKGMKSLDQKEAHPDPAGWLF